MQSWSSLSCYVVSAVAPTGHVGTREGALLLKLAPARDVRAHERLEEPPVSRHAQVQQLVRDDEVLEARVLVDEIARQLVLEVHEPGIEPGRPLRVSGF